MSYYHRYDIDKYDIVHWLCTIESPGGWIVQGARAHLLSIIGKYFLFVRTGIRAHQVDLFQLCMAIVLLACAAGFQKHC